MSRSNRRHAGQPLSGTPMLVLTALLCFPLARAHCQTEKCPGELRFEAIGEKVPAFGGLFVDESTNTLYAYMVPNQAGEGAALRSGCNRHTRLRSTDRAAVRSASGSVHIPATQ